MPIIRHFLLSVTEAKAAVTVPPVYRQSISERKVPGTSWAVKPSSSHAVPPDKDVPARKSLYNKFGYKKRPPAGLKLPAVGGDQNEFLQPSLIKLTRESIRYLPRESLAWISQLPRFEEKLSKI